MRTTRGAPGLRLGLMGLVPHKWPSINRTLAFYRQALEPFAGSLADIDEASGLSQKLDLIVNCTGDAGWKVAAGERSVPIAFCMHGGCVLDRSFIRDRLPSLWSTDTFIVNCHSDKHLLERMVVSGGPQIAVLPLPVDTGRFCPEGRAQARAELGIGEDEFCVGVVARLLPQKNVHGALEVVAEVARRRPARKLRMVIIGNFWADYPVLRFDGPPYSQQLRSCIEQLGLDDLVTYLPAKLNDVELARAYRAFDVLLHPTHSIDENFGYAPVEAMASGVPVVGCAYGGLKDTVVHGKTGLLADTWLSLGGIREDRSALVRAVCWLVDDSALREQMGAEARRHAMRSFSVQHCMQRLQDIVLTASKAWRSLPRERPVLAAQADYTMYDQYLKPRSDLLSSYAESVTHYASGAVPLIESGYMLRRYGKLHEEKVGHRLANAAWPALYPLSPRQREITEALVEPADFSDISSRYSAEELQALVDMGILVTSRPEVQ